MITLLQRLSNFRFFSWIAPSTNVFIPKFVIRFYERSITLRQQHFFARIGSPFSSSWANFIPLIFIYLNSAKSSLFPFKLRCNHKNKSFFVFDLFFLFYYNFSFLFSSFWWSNLLFIYSFKRYKIIDLKNSVILFISS